MAIFSLPALSGTETCVDSTGQRCAVGGSRLSFGVVSALFDPAQLVDK